VGEELPEEEFGGHGVVNGIEGRSGPHEDIDLL